jgi:hypothetical protein
MSEEEFYATMRQLRMPAGRHRVAGQSQDVPERRAILLVVQQLIEKHRQLSSTSDARFLYEHEHRADPHGPQAGSITAMTLPGV